MRRGAGTGAEVIEAAAARRGALDAGGAAGPRAFVGGEAGRRIVGEIDQGPIQRRIGLNVDGRQPVREGALILDGEGNEIGRITSGTFSPSLQRPIAMGYVAAASAEPGTAPIALVRARGTDDVATVLRVCDAHGHPVVPQAGLTGLTGGATPMGDCVVLSLERLAAIESVDVDGSTITVQAGATLQAVQEAADAAGLLFPLDIGARGSCRIGGNASSRALLLLDGVPYTDIKLASLRGQLAMVSQNVVLFDDTLAANIAYGAEQVDYERLAAAVRAAHLTDVVAQAAH